MILTELFNPTECLEAIRLLGGEIVMAYGPNGRVDRVLQYDSDRDRFVLFVYGVGEVACSIEEAGCIIQVAAEQTVNAANVRYYCEHGETHNGPPYAVERTEAEEGNTPFGIATLTEEGKWARHGKPALFQTKLAALLAALRAVKETRDGA